NASAAILRLAPLALLVPAAERPRRRSDWSSPAWHGTAAFHRNPSAGLAHERKSRVEPPRWHSTWRDCTCFAVETARLTIRVLGVLCPRYRAFAFSLQAHLA